MLFNTTPISIEKEQILLKSNDGSELSIKNDMIFIFAGGELPTQFLQKIGLQITKKFGEAILKHK